jgi:purine-nucleoside phosphorylase
MTAIEKLRDCYTQVRKLTDFTPKVALVLGSGLGDFANDIQIVKSIEYSEIENFPISTVQGHRGRFILGYYGGVPMVAMQGRVHYYEGYSMQDVVLPIRLMRLLGAEVLILTNASGGINRELSAGDFMLITDHISTFVPNCLIGQNFDELGTRFPDMSQVYDLELQALVQSTADTLGIPLKRGVYVQLTGCSYETPAEIRMLSKLGADAVGMSTVCEAIAGHHAGMRVCGVSCVTNMASGILDKPLNHKEVQEIADRVSPNFKRLIGNTIESIKL